MTRVTLLAEGDGDLEEPVHRLLRVLLRKCIDINRQKQRYYVKPMNVASGPQVLERRYLYS